MDLFHLKYIISAMFLMLIKFSVLACIGYNIYAMRESACLVFNPIIADNYASFFNYTPVVRASDS